MDSAKKICNFCSAWRSYDSGEPKGFGYCKRYGMRSQAFEWCETWDDRSGTRPRKIIAPIA